MTSKIREILIAAGCVVGGSMVAGCGGHDFFVAAPPGFVELEDQEPTFDYRATSADGVVIAVRQIEHKPKGDQAFWVQAIKNRMREKAGYALLRTSEVTTKSGMKGTKLEFGHDENGQSMLYTVTLFVTEKNLFLLEFGGTKEEVTRQSRYLDWVIENFRQA